MTIIAAVWMFSTLTKRTVIIDGIMIIKIFENLVGTDYTDSVDFSITLIIVMIGMPGMTIITRKRLIITAAQLVDAVWFPSNYTISRTCDNLHTWKASSLDGSRSKHRAQWRCKLRCRKIGPPMKLLCRLAERHLCIDELEIVFGPAISAKHLLPNAEDVAADVDCWGAHQQGPYVAEHQEWHNGVNCDF